MKQRIIVLLTVFVCLLGGVFLYVVNRPGDLYLNKWIIHITGENSIQFIKGVFHNSSNPGWLVYSLPDALWMVALTLMILVIWEFKINAKSVVWLTAAIFSALLFECLQASQIIRGTFDPVDMVFILLGALIPISITIVNVKTCQTS